MKKPYSEYPHKTPRVKNAILSGCVVSVSVFDQQPFRDFFDLTNDMIQIFSPEGTILEVNPAWRKILEYLEEDLSHVTVFHTIKSKDKKECQAVFEAVFKDGKPRKFFATLLTKTGKEIITEGTVGRLAWQGNSFALFGLFHDVTRRKEYEDLKDEFISTVSHELRTPLTVVREGVAQIQDGLFGEIPGDQKTLLDMVIQNIDRLGRIIEELLDVSKLEAGQVRLQRSLCNVVSVVKEVVREFESLVRKKGLEIRMECEKEKIEIYIDREKIIQVLNNLINNSLKFTQQGSIKVSVREMSDFVECKVEDTGKGIPPKDLSKAFDNFSQFGREMGPGDRGTGLGLPICKKLIELHHGRVVIDSSPIKGTSVTFLLPKYVQRDFFRETIEEAMKKCQNDGQPLSVIIFDVVGFDVLKKTLGSRKAERIVGRMESLINKALRRTADIAIKDTKAILVLLPETYKESAYIVLGRLSQLLEDYLAGERKSPKIEIRGSVACFPEEAADLEKILKKIYE